MNACDTPDKLVWLLRRISHPALTAVYDYGHFQLANLTIEDSMDELLPHSALITVKDSKLVNGKPRFLLPGDGTIDYARYFRKVKALNWKGWVLVEVTRQLQMEPGYDGEKAARKSYGHLAPILSAMGLRPAIQ
jgi:sugar phosphate isomerase/epimerase